MLFWKIAEVQPKVDWQAWVGRIAPLWTQGVERFAPPPWPKWSELTHPDGGVCLNLLSAPETLTSASGGRASLPPAVC